MIYIRKYKAEYVIAMLFHVLEVVVLFKIVMGFNAFFVSWYSSTLYLLVKLHMLL